MSFSHKKHNYFNVLKKITLVTVGFLIILEIVFRIILYIDFSPFQTHFSIQGTYRWINHPKLVWDNRPFYLDYSRKNQYNEIGFKTVPKDVFMPEKSEDDFWVFLFGGSTMAGMGANKDKDWFAISEADDHTQEISIEGHLEKILQRKMPDKKVRVFNAAVSMYTVHQVFEKYKLLEKYNPDWIISMDGVNEPTAFSNTDSIENYLMNYWQQVPVNDKKIQWQFFLMSHSAFCYKVLKEVYDYKQQKRRETLDKKKIQHKWNFVQPKEIDFIDKLHQQNIIAVSTFLKEERMFHDYLESVQQKHILFVQPYLAFRDPSSLRDKEKVTHNYFTHIENDKYKNSFFKAIYDSIRFSKVPIHSLDTIHKEKSQMFVDYCHLTPRANQIIAEIFAEKIIN